MVSKQACAVVTAGTGVQARGFDRIPTTPASLLLHNLIRSVHVRHSQDHNRLAGSL